MTSATARAPTRGWYYGWNIVAVCLLSQVGANGLTYGSFSLFLRDWSRDLHTPISGLQLSVLAMTIVSAIASPMIGVLADKYPGRRLLAVGLAGIAVFYFAVSAVTARWQFLALYGLVAPVALCLATQVPANSLISRWFVY